MDRTHNSAFVYEMPDNTWLTPYKFRPSRCLSFGPSQGIVYKISEKCVVKVPFQYPVSDASSLETYEHLFMSLQSFAIAKKESAFYDLLANKPHPNIAQRQKSKRVCGIILEYVRPLEHVWSVSPREMRLGWIQQLLSALERIEGLGYTHGDIKIRNLGIDYDYQLKLFDFGSVVHRDDNDFYEQVLEDHFNLATCIHFLASGVDPLAKVECFADLRQTLSKLREGRGVVDEAAKDFEEIIQAGWTRVPRSPPSFQQLCRAVSDIIGDSTMTGTDTPEVQLGCDDWVAEKEPRWVDEQDYRAAWKEKGYEAPVGI